MTMISVITPTFNGGEYIEYCIRNVIEQNCPHVEHVIVDGGSKDGTVEILERYAAEYPHIRWISEKDEGQSDAMNKGIAMARGTFISFLNDDDFYNPGVLNRVCELLPGLAEPAMLVGNTYVVDKDGKIISVNKPSKMRLYDLLLGPMINPFPVNPTAYFYHRSLHDVIGPYKVSEHFIMDVDFLLRAVQAAHVTYVDEDWGNIRYIEGTKTHSDTQNGTSGPRIEEMMKGFRKDLSPIERLKVSIGYEFHNNKAPYWRLVRKVWRRANRLMGGAPR